MKCRHVVLGPEPKPQFKADTRTYRVQLDCNQYQKDMMDIVKGHEVGCFLCVDKVKICKLHTPVKLHTSQLVFEVLVKLPVSYGNVTVLNYRNWPVILSQKFYNFLGT